jgi:RNA polymerase-binding transcription factor DksA
MIENINHFKEMLVKECTRIETELKTVARKNPDQAGDWEATEPVSDDATEEADFASNMEQFENNNAIVEQLETQLGDVKAALEKIENGTYGVCETGGEEIEMDRLEANPSARTCKMHMNN